MDTLIAIGATFSIAYGIYCLFMISMGYTEYHMYLYFEAAGMILTLVSLGKYLEKLSKRKTTTAIEKLMDLSPKEAVVLKDNIETKVKIEEVKLGDIVVVKKGDSVPVDGKIIEGNASIDQSNITGESIPVYKTANDDVYSSTIVTAGYIKVKATKVGEDTSIANIIKLVDEASNSKAPISKLADKICSSYFSNSFSYFYHQFNRQQRFPNCSKLCYYCYSYCLPMCLRISHTSCNHGWYWQRC